MMHIHTVVGAKEIPYWDFMRNAMVKLAFRPDQLAFHRYAPSPEMTSSAAHADGLRKALDCFVDGEINIICDSDTVMVMKGWDEFACCAMLSNFDCFGTTFADLGEYGAGDGPVQMYKGHPTFTWLACAPHGPWKALDPSRKPDTMAITTQEQSALYRLPVGLALLRDVGWRIPCFLKEHGLTSFGMPRAKKGNRVVLEGLSDYHEEFTVPQIQRFVCHQRGSSKHPFRNSPFSSPFYDACERWIEKL